jgi:thiamine biosynthesis lipoprotein
MDTTFRCMGTDVRLLAESAPAAVVERERLFLEDFARRLSRFVPGSELSELNRDPREAVPASPLLRAAVGAGVWAAQRTEGLVDPTLVDDLERGGYGASREGVEPASLSDALATTTGRRPARPSTAASWRGFDVRGETVRRPPGVRIDTGGTGKGLAADAVAQRLSAAGVARFVVDCGGDIAVRGPFDIAVEHPLTGKLVETLQVRSGGVATSGIGRRIWQRPDGSYAHHLLDPSTGEPAWTGLISATAVGGSALEAETLAKQALLSGPAAAREILAERGGVLVHDDGGVELAGPAQ